MSILNQKTIKAPIEFQGITLHKGKIAKVKILPAKPNSGIVFKRIDIKSNNLIEAAACILPLTESKTLNPEMGTRHRAALGISEESDALAVVISEESGKISVAENGYFISSGLSLDELGKILKEKMNEFIEEN